MKKRNLTALFVSVLLLVSCKEPDFVDTTVKLIPNENTETNPAQFVENFNGYRVVYTQPFNTEVTDSNGNTLLTFEGCDYRISGELLIIQTVGEDTDYLIYKKDLSPVTADGKPAEFAHKFDEIAMCEDGGFTATAKHNGVLLRFASDGSLESSTAFEKLFTVGSKPESGDPVAAVSDGDKLKFVTPVGEVLAELPFAPHLNYSNSYYAERDGMKGLYFHVAFKGGATYYFCPESGDSGVIGLNLPSEELLYNNNYISAYRTDDGVEVRQRLGGDIHLYEDVLIGEYYDPVFGTTETEAVFLKSNGIHIEFYTYNYGSARKGAEGKIYSLIENYILIGSTLYDYHLNGLYSLGNITLEDYSVDETTGAITVIGTLSNGSLQTYKFYPTLPQTVLSEDAELLSEYNGGSNNKVSVYKQSDGYIHHSTETGLTLKLPIDKEAIHVSAVWNGTDFAFVDDDGLHGATFSTHYISHNGIGKAPALFSLTEYDATLEDVFGDGYIASLNYTDYYIKNDGSRVQLLGEIADPSSKDDPRDCSYNIVGNYIRLFFGPYIGGYLFDTSLNQVVAGTVSDFTLLDDGRYIGKVYKNEKSSAFIINTDGTVNYIDAKGGSVLKVGKGYIFILDADSVHRLYTPDMELLCEFTEIEEEWSYFDMVSGSYEKDGKLGYYFVFEDINDNKNWTEGAEWGEYGTRNYEFYYIPSTGESGMIDLGYTDYALAKPVLYLYPIKETNVTVTFAHPERLTTVYPSYSDGWNVTAKPNGTLTDARGREYYCLYWEESSGKSFYDFPDGFCVAAEDSAAFLEEKLEILGFTEKEANEFIIYWLPIMEQSEYNLIRFELTEEREASNALHIFPAPDSLLRIAMHIKPLDNAVSIREQELPKFDRSGFVAVEWGGCVH